MLDTLDHLIALADAIDWGYFEKSFARYYSQEDSPAKPIRLMVGLLLLKQLENYTAQTGQRQGGFQRGEEDGRGDGVKLTPNRRSPLSSHALRGNAYKTYAIVENFQVPNYSKVRDCAPARYNLRSLRAYQVATTCYA